jgi:hypothetical protein
MQTRTLALLVALVATAATQGVAAADYSTMQKFGISTAVFVAATLVWIAVCFLVEKFCDAKEDTSAPIAAFDPSQQQQGGGFQPVAVPSAGGPGYQPVSVDPYGPNKL